MSVWPKTLPTSPALSGSEGALVSVSIDVHARYLESLLEALARVEFPINPQIYHDAAIVSIDADGREERRSATLVEFPAYADRLDEVRRALEAAGFDPSSLCVTSMLDEIHIGGMRTAAPPAPKRVVKRAAAILQ